MENVNDHQRTTALVLAAIGKASLVNGATLEKITSYIKSQYPLQQRSAQTINKALDKAIAFGAVQKKRNKYVLGNVWKSITSSRRSSRRRRRSRSRRGRRRRSSRSRRRRSGSRRRRRRR